MYILILAVHSSFPPFFFLCPLWCLPPFSFHPPAHLQNSSTPVSHLCLCCLPCAFRCRSSWSFRHKKWQTDGRRTNESSTRVRFKMSLAKWVFLSFPPDLFVMKPCRNHSRFTILCRYTEIEPQDSEKLLLKTLIEQQHRKCQLRWDQQCLLHTDLPTVCSKAFFEKMRHPLMIQYEIPYPIFCSYVTSATEMLWIMKK